MDYASVESGPVPMSTLPPTVAPYTPMPVRCDDTHGDAKKACKKARDEACKGLKGDVKKKCRDEFVWSSTSAGGVSSVAPVSSGGGSWKKATATWYSSYPECCHDKSADQSECEDFSGCKYEGLFAGAKGKQPKDWVEKNNIVAFYEAPNDRNRKEWNKKWSNKKIRVRNTKTGKVLEAVILDTCDDGDCNGCCSKNAKKNGGYLVDFERNTAKRFYDGDVQDMSTVEWQLV